MKKSILISLLVAAMGVIAFMGCERPETIDPTNGQPQRANEDSLINQQQIEHDTVGQIPQNVEFSAVEVDFSRYHLTGNCVDYDTAYIINSRSQMESLIGECYDSLPTIDFNSGTLVYVLAYVPDILFKKKSTFEKLSALSYTFTIDLYMGDATYNPPVPVAYYVVPKLENTDSINVIKNEYEYDGE